MALLVVLLAVSALSRAAAPPAPPPAPENAYDLAWDLRIPMRDGVGLHAALYRPHGLTAPAPVLLLMTPYTADSFHREAAYLAGRGYVVAAVDVRGRGGSEGTFEPFRNDGRDGYDAVEWLARQPFANGRVGMLGHSYGGRAVWSTIREAPPHLAAAAPISASYPMVDWRNIVTPDMVQWVLLTSGATTQAHVLADSDFWIAKLRELYLSRRPLRDFDRIVGSPSALFQRLLDHPTLDPFWSSVAPGPADFAKLDLPILTVTGEHEGNHIAALWYYREQARHAPAAALAKHRVLIGPWDHHGTLRPAREAGGLAFGPAAEVDMKELLAGWFDHALRGAPLPALLADPIRYYVQDAEEWRGARQFDPLVPAAAGEARPEPWTLYLDSRDGANRLSRPGRLAATRAAGRSADAWTYDPLDLREGLAETAEVAEWATRFDAPDDLWGTGLVYMTDPLPGPATLAGFPRLQAWLAIDVPDTDFAVRLDLVTPEGGTVLLGEDWVRARFRTSLEREEKVPPGVPLEYAFELPFTARRLPAGGRLRLILRSPNSIFTNKNWNGGGVVAEESGKDARTAHVTLLHDRDHPSRLELEVLGADRVSRPPHGARQRATPLLGSPESVPRIVLA